MKSRRNVRRGKRGATPAISKPTFEIELTERFRELVRDLPKSTRREVARTIDGLREALGQPHRHAGLGIRKLHRNYFECRVGLSVRWVFRIEPGSVVFTFAGHHDEVRRYAQGTN